MSSSSSSSSDTLRLIREHAHPLTVEPTGEASRLTELPKIEAILFDVYGTLFISGSGDIGLTAEGDRDRAMTEALQGEGIVTTPAMRLGEGMKAMIRESHARSKDRGVAFPEVEIRRIWAALLENSGLRLSEDVIERVAIRYESLANPVWPMPGARQTLLALKEAGKVMGIISNAQFYTPPLFEALLEGSPGDLGFREDLCLWSYEESEAKPSPGLFTKMRKVLAAEGVAPERVLYVGNDMRNDIAPAASAGLRTALFAGDARSLRRREEDELGVEPDLVLTELEQLIPCVR